MTSDFLFGIVIGMGLLVGGYACWNKFEEEVLKRIEKNRVSLGRQSDWVAQVVNELNDLKDRVEKLDGKNNN